jgi:hypothetical protein
MNEIIQIDIIGQIAKGLGFGIALIIAILSLPQKAKVKENE